MIEGHRKQPELLEHGTKAIGRWHLNMEPGVTFMQGHQTF